jgi:hypothetical protein
MVCDKIGVEGCALVQPTYENPDGREFAGTVHKLVPFQSPCATAYFLRAFHDFRIEIGPVDYLRWLPLSDDVLQGCH